MVTPEPLFSLPFAFKQKSNCIPSFHRCFKKATLVGTTLVVLVRFAAKKTIFWGVYITGVQARHLRKSCLEDAVGRPNRCHEFSMLPCLLGGKALVRRSCTLIFGNRMPKEHTDKPKHALAKYDIYIYSQLGETCFLQHLKYTPLLRTVVCEVLENKSRTIELLNEFRGFIGVGGKEERW